MSETQYTYIPYTVSYSDRVREELRSLLLRAQVRGKLSFAAQAAKAIDTRLRIYPQAGEPIKDLALTGNVLWSLAIEPFFVQYILNEERRLVFVAAPFRLMRNAGF